MAVPPAEPQQSAASAPCVKDANVVVLGGGPCGALTAMLLEKRGIPTTLIERNADFLKFEISKSYVIAIFGSGWSPMEEIPGLIDYMRRAAIPSTVSSCTIVTAEGLKIPIMTGMKIPGDESVVLLRARLLQTLKTFVQERTSVNAMFGTAVDHIDFKDDGSMDVRVTSSENTSETINTRFIIACDGKNSIVTKHLREAEEEGAKGSGCNVHSERGFALRRLHSPSVGMMANSVVLNSNTLEKLNVEFAMSDQPIVRINGVQNERVEDNFFLNVWPMNESDTPFFGGLLAMLARPPEHPIWHLNNVDEAFAAFEKNFPQLDVRACITPESMQNFLSSTPLVFPAITRCASLAATIGREVPDSGGGGGGGGGGVIIMGDAAHCFPPNLGLGTNSAFNDAAFLMRLIDDAKAGDTVVDIAKRYHAQRDGDVDALVKIVQKGAPYLFSDESFSASAFRKMAMWRTKLAHWLPGFIHPPIAIQTRSSLSYSEIWRRAKVSTFRIYVGLFSLVGIPVTAFLVRPLMSSKRT